MGLEPQGGHVSTCRRATGTQSALSHSGTLAPSSTESAKEGGNATATQSGAIANKRRRVSSAKSPLP